MDKQSYIKRMKEIKEEIKNLKTELKEIKRKSLLLRVKIQKKKDDKKADEIRKKIGL